MSTTTDKERKQQMLNRLIADVVDTVMIRLRGNYVTVDEYQIVLKRLYNLETQLQVISLKMQMDEKREPQAINPNLSLNERGLKHHKYSAKELVLDTLEVYGGSKGLTIREIQTYTGLSGTAGIKEAVQRLKRAGVVSSETAWPEANSNVCRYYLTEKKEALSDGKH